MQNGSDSSDEDASMAGVSGADDADRGAEAPLHPRKIVSFVRRQGRMTSGQQRAMDEFWPRYGLDLATVDGKIDLDALFGRSAKRVLEIGFGMGQSLAEMARQDPDTDFLGIEVHRPGVGHLLMQSAENDSTNVRVICDDAVRLIRDHLSDASLDGVHVYFPDPWHKLKHRKRRLIQPDFLALLLPRIKVGGYLHCATDWHDYAKQMLRVLSGTDGLSNRAGDEGYLARPDWRPETKFERRGARLGHGVWDLIFDKH